MVVCGLELVNLCETRKWNTQFHRKISNGKTGLPFQKFHFFRKFSSGTNRKIMFHLQPNRNFRNLLVNGKHPVLSIMPKIPEISVGIQMERSVSVSSDRNIRDHSWSTYFGRNIPTEICRSIFDKAILCPN